MMGLLLQAAFFVPLAAVFPLQVCDRTDLSMGSSSPDVFFRQWRLADERATLVEPPPCATQPCCRSIADVAAIAGGVADSEAAKGADRRAP